MIVQVYGVTTVDDARAVAEAGADHLGVVPVTTTEATWDAVDAATADAILAATVETGVARVVLSFARAPEEAVAVATRHPCEWLHLARADAWRTDDLDAIRTDIDARLMLTVPVRDSGAVEIAERLAPHGDALLLDTAHPESGIVGASGHVHDWSVSARVVAASAVPVVLAGGLGPENVAAAVEAVRPWGVDSETRTSRDDDRRRKDPDRVRRFVRAARAAGHP